MQLLQNNLPKITFGIIVLNGEPFVKYNLRSLYPFAHEIIVVEGGHEDAKAVCTPDGHSLDTTLQSLYEFKENEDPENKVQIITRNGFWPKRDEFGHDRTFQSRAYAERATGDYLWQVDIDEFYKEEDIEKIIKLLQSDPRIDSITFPTITFWGDIKYKSDCWRLQQGSKYFHRLFKWGKGYKYITHEPPTVIDENGVDLRTKKWLKGEELEKMDIYMFHYSLLFPWQVEQKIRLYKDEKPESCSGIVDWAENNYFKITNPFRVHNLYTSPSWLEYFPGEHTEQIYKMMDDVRNNKNNIKLRNNEDVEKLLKRFSYKLPRLVYKTGGYINKHYLFIRQSIFRILRKTYRTFVPKKISNNL